ncbi:MAG: stage V sporulation protein AA, partial [Faecalimonas sp.]|nr:stage V sporulation protein AA [Faecalimonas sp.]
LGYSVGLVAGILVFFNHFGKKKISVDPTPIEVEMRLYENDIQTTVIAEYSRKGQELDVGETNTTGNHWT